MRGAQQHGSEFPSPSGTIPAFEAVYVPSDVIWSIELSDIVDDPTIGPDRGAVLQRFLVTLSSVQSVGNPLRSLVTDDPRLENAVLKGIRDLLPLNAAPNTLAHLDLLLRRTAYEVRGRVNRRRPDEIADFINALPREWLGHPLDVPIAFCEVFGVYAGDIREGPALGILFRRTRNRARVVTQGPTDILAQHRPAVPAQTYLEPPTANRSSERGGN